MPPKLTEAPQEDTTEKINPNDEVKETFCIGQVIKIISEIEEELPGGNKQRSQQLLIRIVSGPESGKKRASLNLIPDNPGFAIVGEPGRKYLINKIENLNTGNEEYFVVDYYRAPFVWFLVTLFAVLLLIVGGKKGVRTIVSLIGTIIFIGCLLIPSIEKGVNPLLAAVAVSFLATAFTMLLVAGINFKSLSSTLGTVIGVTFSGILATYIINAAPLSGLASSEAMILWGNEIYKLNFKGLLAAGMIVSCLGAVMDVAISISSAIQEIKKANPRYTMRNLFTAGMNVGKDIMGTMTSTLVLAFTGMALPLLLLINHEKDPLKYMNLELVTSEITAAIAGSVGLIIAVPATSLIMSYFMSKGKNQPVSDDQNTNIINF